MEVSINLYMGVCQVEGYHFGDPHNKDYNILGSILGSPYFGKPPYSPFVSTHILIDLQSPPPLKQPLLGEGGMLREQKHAQK